MKFRIALVFNWLNIIDNILETDFVTYLFLANNSHYEVEKQIWFQGDSV